MLSLLNVIKLSKNRDFKSIYHSAFGGNVKKFEFFECTFDLESDSDNIVGDLDHGRGK